MMEDGSGKMEEGASKQKMKNDIAKILILNLRPQT